MSRTQKISDELFLAAIRLVEMLAGTLIFALAGALGYSARPPE